MDSLENNASREDECKQSSNSCTCELKSYPYARYEYGTQEGDGNDSGADQRKPYVVWSQRSGWGEEKAVQVQPEREKTNGIHK